MRPKPRLRGLGGQITIARETMSHEKTGASGAGSLANGQSRRI